MAAGQTGTFFLGTQTPNIPVSPNHPALSRVPPRFSVSQGVSSSLIVPPKTIAPLADALLTTIIARPIVQTAIGGNYDRVFVEGTHEIRTGGDIERITHLYITHGVNLILQNVVAALPGAPVLRCQSQATVAKGRFDMSWTVGGNVVFVLELKNK